MELFRRIIFAAVLAGALAGLAYAAVQQWRMVPLIHQAESFEGAGHDHSASHGADDHAHAHAHADNESQTTRAEPWAPADGVERTIYTVVATVLASVGFALIMGGISIVANTPITAQNGLVWGLAGFAAFTLAPAFGLPPELPGMPAGDLAARQVWWWSTALATGAALLAIALVRKPWAVALAIVVMAVPHIMGAPVSADAQSDVPAHLAATFVATSLAGALIFWVAMGVIFGWVNTRLFGANS